MSCLWTKMLLQKHHVALYWPQLHLPTLPCNGKDQRAAGKQHTRLAQHQSGCPNRLCQGQVFHSFSVALHQCSQPVSRSKPVTLCCMTPKAWQSISLGPHHQNLNMVFYFIVICRANFFPRDIHKEQIHTFVSITASGGAGLLRMTLSPFCTGKIICKHNAHTQFSTTLYFTQIPVTLRRDLPSSGHGSFSPAPILQLKFLPTQICQASIFAHILLPNSWLPQMPGKKCNFVSPFSKSVPAAEVSGFPLPLSAVRQIFQSHSWSPANHNSYTLVFLSSLWNAFPAPIGEFQWVLSPAS